MSEGVAAADGQHQRCARRTEILLQRRHHLVELSVVGIHSRYHEHARATQLLREFPGFARPDFDSRRGVNGDDSQFHHRQRPVNLTYEVGRPGGVYNVDVPSPPRGMKHGGVNRFLPLFLVLVEIAGRRPVTYPAKAVNVPAFQQHRFAQHGFAVARVPNKSHVTDFERMILSHYSPLPCPAMTVLT